MTIDEVSTHDLSLDMVLALRARLAPPVIGDAALLPRALDRLQRCTKSPANPLGGVEN